MSLQVERSQIGATLNVARRQTLQLTDIKSNSNKYYTLELRETDAAPNACLFSVYGRTGLSKTEDFRNASLRDCQREFDRLVKSKQKKGYEIVETLDTTAAPAVVASKSECPIENFVNYIFSFSREYVKTNVTSPIGKLTVRQVEKAQGILKQIAAKINDPVSDEILDLHNDFYKAMPQNLPRKISIADVLLRDEKQVAQQEDMLQQVKDMVSVKESDTKFDERYAALGAKIEIPDAEEIERITEFVKNTKSTYHKLKAVNIKSILKLRRDKDEQEYDFNLAKLLEMEAFHGSKNSNVLGICSRGLMLPGQHSSAITGAMFGPGLYGALHSTKSMQYCGTGYYDRNVPDQGDRFLFVMQMAMGEFQTGSDWRRHRALPPTKHSTWAKRGEDGLLHDELIVYKTNQVKLTHIIQFNTEGTFY